MLDFNIKIVKINTNNGQKFYYACNLPNEKMIDLIEVSFIGHHLLETPYNRTSVPHESYVLCFELGAIVNSTPHELQMYAIENFMAGNESEDNESFEEECCEDMEEEIEQDLEEVRCREEVSKDCVVCDCENGVCLKLDENSNSTQNNSQDNTQNNSQDISKFEDEVDIDTDVYTDIDKLIDDKKNNEEETHTLVIEVDEDEIYDKDELMKRIEEQLNEVLSWERK